MFMYILMYIQSVIRINNISTNSRRALFNGLLIGERLVIMARRLMLPAGVSNKMFTGNVRIVQISKNNLYIY